MYVSDWWYQPKDVQEAGGDVEEAGGAVEVALPLQTSPSVEFLRFLAPGPRRRVAVEQDALQERGNSIHTLGPGSRRRGISLSI